MNSEIELRAIVMIPLAFVGSIFEDVDDVLNDGIFNDANLGLGWEGRLKPRTKHAGVIRWTSGSLKTASASNIPCEPFNISIGRDLPENLRKIVGENRNTEAARANFWNYRSSTSFFQEALPSGIAGLRVEGIEALSYPHAETQPDTILLAFHLVGNDNLTNRQSILELSRPHNQPAKNLLYEFFKSPYAALSNNTDVPKGRLVDNYDLQKQEVIESDLNWRIPEIFESTLTVTGICDDGEGFGLSNQNLICHIGSDDRELTRFATKFLFLTALINVQKRHFDEMRRRWPNLIAASPEEVMSKRAEIAYLRNNWWWKRISYDDQLQQAYEYWTGSLDFQGELNLYAFELNEYWAIEAARKNQSEAIELAKLNNLAKLFAIFGIVPGWIALLAAPLNGWLSVILGITTFGALLKMPTARVNQILEKLSRKFG